LTFFIGDCQIQFSNQIMHPEEKHPLLNSKRDSKQVGSAEVPYYVTQHLTEGEKVLYMVWPNKAPFVRGTIILVSICAVLFLGLPLLAVFIDAVSGDISTSEVKFGVEMGYLGWIVLSFWVTSYAVGYRYYYKNTNILYVMTTERALIIIPPLRWIFSKIQHAQVDAWSYAQMNTCIRILESDDGGGAVYFGRHMELHSACCTTDLWATSIGFQSVPNVAIVEQILIEMLSVHGVLHSHVFNHTNAMDIINHAKASADRNPTFKRIQRFFSCLGCCDKKELTNIRVTDQQYDKMQHLETTSWC